MRTGIYFMAMEIVKAVLVTLGGLGVFLFGMKILGDYLQNAAGDKIKTMLGKVGNNRFAAVGIGTAVTAVIQSSSATTGILITMAGQGLVTLDAALFATLGINIGTCVTALLAGIGANANAKRASVIHLLFNCFGSFVFFFICYFAPVSSWLQAAFPEIQTQIAMFHTFFNVITTLLLIGFIKPLVKLATLIVPDRKRDGEEGALKYADERLLSSPAVAIGQVRRELMRVLDDAYANLTLSLDAIRDVDLSRTEEFDKRDQSIMKSKGALVQYLIKLSDMEPGVEAETEIATYHKTISDIDRIADLAQNVMEFTASLKQNNSSISESGIAELEQMRGALDALKECVCEEFDRKDISMSEDIEKMEQRVDELYLAMEEAHLARMKSGECTAFTATIYIPLINNLERIGDHLFNIFRGMKTYVKAPAKHEEASVAV